MSEATMWSRVRTALKGLDPVRVENKIEAGTPDVNYLKGWVELKSVPHAPVRGGVLTIEHFTPQQRTWLTRRRWAGGNAYLLLKVSNEWLLFLGEVAAETIGKYTIKELREVAIGRWLIKLQDEELRGLLTTDFLFQKIP